MTSQQTVVIAVNYEAESDRAVKFYIERVHRPGSRVLLLHCIDLPPKPTRSIDPQTKPTRRDSKIKGEVQDDSSVEALIEMWEEEESYLKLLETRLTFLFMNNQIPVTLYSAVGRPNEIILRVAETQEATLIVLGCRHATEKKTGIRSLMSKGGVSDYVLRNATCPVIVCRIAPDVTKQRPRCASESLAAGEMPLSIRHKKHRHSSADTFANRIRRRFSSGGHLGIGQHKLSINRATSVEERCPEEEEEEGHDEAFSAPITPPPTIREESLPPEMEVERADSPPRGVLGPPLGVGMTPQVLVASSNA